MRTMFKKVITKLVSPFTFKRTILLESECDLCDSSKTIFDKLIELGLNYKYKIYWCVNDAVSFANYSKKYKNVKFIKKANPSFREKILYSLAKYVIYTHSFLGNKYNNRQIRLFVTHAAMPIKNSKGWFGDDPYFHTFICGTSDECIRFRQQVLGFSDNYVITGLPRNDDLFKNNLAVEKWLINNKKMVVWMPTFKHHNNSSRNDFSVEKDNDISLLTKENIEIINKKCVSLNILLIIKPHPSQDLSFFNSFSLSNVVTINDKYLRDNNINLYSLLGESEGLITDFSSVFVDYLLLDRPIGFEFSDKALYENGIGFVMNNPDDYMPGDKMFNLQDFLSFLDKIAKGQDDYKEERNVLKNRLHFYCDSNSTYRVLRLLKII